MADRVRRQHTVSRFYLNGFANDAGRVSRYSMVGGASVVLSTGDATVIKDFYTITLPDGSLSDFFERAFGDIEGAAAEALRRILAGEWPIEGDHRRALATWVALQHLRSENVRSNQGGLNSQVIRLLVGVSGKEALRTLIQDSECRVVSDDELDWEWKDITKPGGPDIVSNANEHVRTLVSLLDSTAAYLNDCHWTLYRFSRRSIITSDHPVSLVVATDYPSWRGVGIATADLFLIPLSRRHALIIQPRDRIPPPTAETSDVPDFSVAGTTRIAKSVNQEIIHGSRKYIYHHPDDSPLQGLIIPQTEMRNLPVSSDTSGLIREDGIFGGMTEDQLRPFKPTGLSSELGHGMTIDDLTWPIPGRRSRYRG